MCWAVISMYFLKENPSFDARTAGHLFSLFFVDRKEGRGEQILLCIRWKMLNHFRFPSSSLNGCMHFIHQWKLEAEWEKFWPPFGFHSTYTFAGSSGSILFCNLSTKTRQTYSSKAEAKSATGPAYHLMRIMHGESLQSGSQTSPTHKIHTKGGGGLDREEMLKWENAVQKWKKRLLFKQRVERRGKRDQGSE